MADLPSERQFGDYGTWPGREVLDADGERLGAVREIYLDRETHQPEWVLVDVNGGDQRFVPLADAAIDDATIRVAHRRDAVAAAPGIGAEPRIDPDQERRLYAHYGVPYSHEQSRTVLPETDTAASEYAAATPDPKPGEEEHSEGWVAPAATAAAAATPQATTPAATPAAAIPPPDPVSAAQPEPAVPEPPAASPEPPPAAPAWEATGAPQPETAASPPPEPAPAPSNGATTPQPEPALPPAPEPPQLPPPAAASHDDGLLDKARSRPAIAAAILAALALLAIVWRLRD